MFLGIGISLVGQLRASLSAYAVGAFEPDLVFAFEPEYYRTGGVDRASLSDAMTFARAGSATYVDATGTIQTAAANVPRVGHHVWNGSAWVNEGLLHESEARTNLITNSESVPSGSGSSVTANDAVAPDGASTADRLVEDSATSTHNAIYSATITANTINTASIYVKAGSGSVRALRLDFADSTYSDGVRVLVNPSTGVVVNSEVFGAGSELSTSIQNAGNGWYRVSVTGKLNASSTAARLVCYLQSNLTVFSASYTGDGTSNLLLWGAQLEAAPTPSSYIPTAGATVTRAADVMTIPAANLPWPSPEYIGPELVTNGTFDTDTTGWNVLFGSISWSGGKLLLTEDGADNATARAYQGITTEVGKVYRVTADVGAVSLGSASIVASTSTNIGGFPAVASAGNETVELIFVAAATTTNIIVNVIGTTARTAEFDNISVREINPLAVSIQMDGRVTYADEGIYSTAVGARWHADFQNRIVSFDLSTNGTETGRVFFLQENADVYDFVGGPAPGSYSPGVLVPFNIASRHGSTFINGAVDGTALTANTTPTALPDLSSDDLTLGYDYMGTIRTFRIWADDIGDAGIAEATS